MRGLNGRLNGLSESLPIFTKGLKFVVTFTDEDAEMFPSVFRSTSRAAALGFSVGSLDKMKVAGFLASM